MYYYVYACYKLYIRSISQSVCIIQCHIVESELVVLLHTVIMNYTNPLVIECESLSDPANGMVTVTGLTPGSIATYTCNNSYQLLGNNTRTCDSNGSWTNMEPTCVRKYLMFSCTNCLCLHLLWKPTLCAYSLFCETHLHSSVN